MDHVTDEMVQAFKTAWEAKDAEGPQPPNARTRAGLHAALSVLAYHIERPMPGAPLDNYTLSEVAMQVRAWGSDA